MEIKSKLLGNQQIDPDTILTFPEGIPGFENQTRFKLFHQENNPIIHWLQAVDDEELTFSVASPGLFNINYSFLLTDRERSLLNLETEDDLVILILLQTDDTQQETRPTIKGAIKAPILINSTRKTGMQKHLVQVEQSITLIEASNEINLQETY
ncbi:MAG: flagellar biosynthesis protein FliW [Gammaproteobacteria bacterium HGW-Gammaproteobacteria-3]|nr:MAG: flagellar biosynthesis protein FliW [Gammaproteobacteria bacterium HGW-Gammaproteobacteria-3]